MSSIKYGLFFLLLAVSFSFFISNQPEPAIQRPLEDVFTIQKIAEADVPTGLKFHDGRLFFSELNSGKIRIYKDGVINDFARVPNHIIPSEPGGEAGLMSMTIDPDFENKPYVYVYYTSNGTSKVGRFTSIDYIGDEFTIIFDGVAQGAIHNGGEITFGPDEKMYLSTGDSIPVSLRLGVDNPSQNISSKNGKILRINRDGSIPSDNPFDDSYTFAYGVRNPFGFDFHPDSGMILESDNGVDCCDEVNIIEEGKNYGWPLEQGINENHTYENPVYSWDAQNRVAPTGGIFYRGPGVYYGSFLLVTWNTHEMYVFMTDGKQVTKVEVLNVPTQGLVDIENGDNGELFISDISGIYKLIPR